MLIQYAKRIHRKATSVPEILNLLPILQVVKTFNAAYQSGKKTTLSPLSSLCNTKPPHPSADPHCCPYNGAKYYDDVLGKVLHHSNKVTRDNSRLSFWCLSLPYKSRVHLPVARAKNKRAYLKVHVMPSSAGQGSLTFPVSHRPHGGRCGAAWRGRQQTPAAHASPGSSHQTWDHAEASPGLGKLKSITEKLMTQLMKQLMGCNS